MHYNYQLELEEKLKDRQTLITKGVAHDLNNLLFCMSSRMELLLLELDTPGKVESLFPFIKSEIADVVQAVKSCAELIENLVAAQAPGSLRKEFCNIGKYIENALSRGAIRNLCVTKDVSLKSIVEADCHFPLSVACMDRALLNLVKNAVEAEAKEVAIRATRELLGTRLVGHDDIPPGEYAVIEVWNNGHCISENDMPHIFQPHYSTKKDPSGLGSGIGLLVFASVAKGHQGFYRVTSNQNDGTSFKMYLPLDDVIV